jgi:hypothetical protein
MTLAEVGRAMSLNHRSTKQATPFFVFAVFALLVSIHAGCTGGLFEDLGSSDNDIHANDYGGGYYGGWYGGYYE